MVSFLQALGAAAPNFMTGLEQGAEAADKRKKSQREDADYLANQKAMKAGADILSKYIGTGDQPAPQPQMGPGQPSQPMQQPASAQAGGTGSPGGDLIMAKYAPAIAGIESGGNADPYSVVGPASRTGDHPYGKYQVMGNNIPEWTKSALGTAMTPEQFLSNKQAQDAVFKHQFGSYLQKTGDPQTAAKMWIGGEHFNPNAKDVLGTTPTAYGQKFQQNLGGGGAPQASQQPQQSSDDVFSRYQQAMKAVWSNKDLAGNFQAQMAAAQHIDQQFKPIMEMAQHQQSMQHQQRQEELGARREADTAKHQTAMEGASVARQQELDRHNQALEERYARQDEERAKHDRATEEAKNAPKPLSASERKAQTAGTGILTQIDKTLSMLDKAEKSGEEVTGLTGMIKRKGGEFLTGGHAASDWEQQIAALQLQVPRALAGVGKLSKGDRDYINSIVEGLGPFRSHEQIRSSMEQLKGIISNVTGLDEQGGQAAPAQPVQSAGSPVPPKPGEVVKGYKFKGGNPADEKSWEKM